MNITIFHIHNRLEPVDLELRIQIKANALAKEDTNYRNPNKPNDHFRYGW